MNDLLEVKICEKGNKKHNGSIESLNKEIKKAPVIYIDSEVAVEIYGNILNIDGNKYDLSKYKIFNIVDILNQHGVDANLTNIKYFNYPAILMSDFKSVNLRLEKIQESPVNLFTYGLSYMDAVYKITESIEFNVIEVKNNNTDNLFEEANGMVYSRATDGSVIMYEEKYIKYLLNVQDYKIINGFNFDKDSIMGSYITSGA